MKVLKAVGVFIIAAVVLVWWLGQWSETHLTTEESYRFERAIPEHVRVMPIVAACDVPRYSYQWRDGERAGTGDVSYTTSLNGEDGLRRIKKELGDLGCEVVRETPDYASLMCGPYVTVNVTTSKSEPCTEVLIGVSGDGPIP